MDFWIFPGLELLQPSRRESTGRRELPTEGNSGTMVTGGPGRASHCRAPTLSALDAPTTAAASAYDRLVGVLVLVVVAARLWVQPLGVNTQRDCTLRIQPERSRLDDSEIDVPPAPRSLHLSNRR